jgi:predicted DNA-binding protein (UPF0251 family)
MPRPKRCRRVCCDPDYNVFKPQGIPMDRLDSIEMGLDEFEALRLSDVEMLSQAEAAKRMDVSQPTFNRILSGARSKTARALTEGVALRIARDTPHTTGTRAAKAGGGR